VHRYQPCDRLAARERLKLPQDRLLVLFGAKDATQDHNKGFHLLQDALSILAGEGHCDTLELLVFGSRKPAGARDSGFRTHYLGWQDEEGIAGLYAAADLFVLPSIQENLPYTVMEAMACGTPCVAFAIGGLSDLIEHKQNGYLAVPHDPVDLAQGIVWVLEDDERRSELAHRARQKVLQNFSMTSIAQQHLELYGELLGQP
jgi:glycosyltransferase involved in cell wall biosynthesis